MIRLFGGLLVAINHLDLNLIALNPRRVGCDLEPRVVSPGAIAHVESPGVPGAGDGPFLVELAGSERSPHVRTEIVDGVVFAADIEHGDKLLADGKSPPLSFRNGTHLGDGNEIGHLAVLGLRESESFKNTR